MKKRCNFNLPIPLVILSTKGLVRNKHRRYIIYPDLSRFRKACLNCRLRAVENKRSRCLIEDSDFLLKFYGIYPNLPKGIYVSLGAVPPDLKAHPLRVEIESFINSHAKAKKNSRMMAENKNLDDRPE